MALNQGISALPRRTLAFFSPNDASPGGDWVGAVMSVGEEQPRAGWLKNVDWLKNNVKLTIALVIAGVVVLGAGAAGAVVMMQQIAAVQEAEAEQAALAAAQLTAEKKQYKELLAGGTGLVKDFEAALVVSAAFLTSEQTAEKAALVEELAAQLDEGTSTGKTSAQLQEEIAALEKAIAEAWEALDAASAAIVAASEAKLAAATLADPVLLQKAADALAQLADALENRKKTAGILESLSAVTAAAEASHVAVVAAQQAAAQKEAERKAQEQAASKPKGDTTKPPVDKSGWYTDEEARQKVVATYPAAKSWYDLTNCVKISWGDWHRDAVPTAPPAVTGSLGFKAGVHYGGENAYVYWYDCD